MKIFRHGGGGGDMLYGLATMKNLGGGLLRLNIDEDKRFYQSLLESQPYIEKLTYYQMNASDWSKVGSNYNLDLFREQPFNTYPLLKCHAMAFNLSFDLSLPWLENIEPKAVSEIVVNDTGKLRWEGITINWNYLKKFESKCIFIGLRHEYINFVRNRNMNVKFYPIRDALEFARVIKGSKLYIGNQSTGLALSEGMKVPRVADLYLGLSKQFPYGDNGYYTLTENLIRRYLNG